MSKVAHETVELFNQWAREGRDIEMAEGHTHAAREALRDVAVVPGGSILDLGCGSGFVTRALAKRLPEASVMGVDAAGEMIFQARDLTPDDLFNAVYYHGSIFDEALKDERFDMIFSMEALYYMLPVAETVKRMVEMLKPGGTIVVVVDYYKENTASHAWARKYSIPMELLSAEDYVKLFEEAGLEGVSSRTVLYPAGEGVEDWKVKKGSLVIKGDKAYQVTAEEIIGDVERAV
ncbi:MAG: class I SAM-dependent methyltransferase [Planctomycetaceae bacterium]|nr:class I SAM-dependent methyltransferase [Planctomycetaceae bacterium]